MKRTAFLALAAMIGLLIAAPAHAVVLPPGSNDVPLTTTAINPLTAAGNTILANTGLQTATNTLNGVTLTVNYQAWVVSVAAANVANTSGGMQVAGNLDFVYQVMVTSTSNTFVNETSHVGFAGTGVGVDTFAQNGTQIAPTNADRSSTATDNGATINFQWNATTVTAGNQSTLNIIETTASAFQAGNYTMEDGVNLTVSAFGVSPLVAASPEPSTMVLAGLGALGFFGYALRRRKALGA